MMPADNPIEATAMRLVMMTAHAKTKYDAASRSWIGKAAIGCLAVLWSADLFAASDTDMTRDYLTCMDKASGETSSMNDCTGAETDRQDARLNDNYKRLMSKLSEDRKKELLEAQRAWIRFRDANCRFYGEGVGSISALAVNDCILDATVDRAKELKRLTVD
jgi:uncharacterized protein YecT (DUF1311 family)